MQRRSFLCLWAAAPARPGPTLEVIPGAVNGVIVRRGGKRLAVYGDPRPSPAAAEKVLLTHARRDAVWAARRLSEQGAAVVAPKAEADLLTSPGKFWDSYEKARYHDYVMLNSKVPAEPLAVEAAVAPGERIRWQDLEIEVLGTPGYTPGAVSYLFRDGGRLVACVGDLLHGSGRLLDLYSLQDGVPEAMLRGYHGYAARAGQLIASLRAVAARSPDLVIPARGPVLDKPREKIEGLITRLKAGVREHFTTDALRWYFGDDNLRLRAAKLLEGEVPEWMPMAEVRNALPDWFLAIGNSRLLLSRFGNAFLIDCGNPALIQKLKEMQAQGRFQRLDGVFITHYHDDHTDRAQACAEAFDCPVLYSRKQADILERPGAFRAPCLTANPIRRGRALADGERWRWHEFEFTCYYLPGQTLWHDSLLAARDGGENVFFVGDSFTPSGLDDYCLWNRNFLARGQGFHYSLGRVRKLPAGCYLVNQHVKPMFRFSSAQLDFMERSLDRRAELLAGVFAWPDVDFALDEQWARIEPYECQAQPRNPLELRVVIWNHSPRPEEFTISLNPPKGWKSGRRSYRIQVPPRSEGAVRTRVTPPAGASGRAVVTAGVRFGQWDLREWVEALVRVG